MPDIQGLLDLCSARHRHLCPRQVLGVRMGLAGTAALGLSVPCPDKRLIVIAETDGCFADGLEVSAEVSVGHRTLRIEDYGKIAAVFVDRQTGITLRLAPRLDARELARQYAPNEPQRYFAQLQAYQVMPDKVLFSITPVVLSTPIEQIISRPGVRVNCTSCGEEIINEREVMMDGRPYCQACAGPAYYQFPETPLLIEDRIPLVSHRLGLG